MRIFRVGGCVRDRAMGFTPKDIDYVVSGATEEEFVNSGVFGLTFTKVGADFPVFIDNNGDEWALARKERKSGTGYHGFEVEFDHSVTIEEDLLRRDLSINSMAEEIYDDMKTRLTHIIDPFNGQKDIENKILRHTSDAFQEDPVRVLRLARFRARFGKEWKVAKETSDLISQMAKKGVLSELTAERVWKEMSRALMEPFPRLFFDTLLECDALHVIFPDIYRLKIALEARRWHPEGDAFEHTMLVLTQASEFGFDLETRMAALVHDFGKGITPRNELPKHYGHDVKGVSIVDNFCDKFTIPSKMKQRLKHVTRFHMRMHDLDKMNSKTFVNMFQEMDAFRDPEVVFLLYKLGVCDERGRLGSEDNDIDHLHEIVEIFERVQSVKFVDVFPNGETNPNKIKSEMFRKRVQAVKEK